MRTDFEKPPTVILLHDKISNWDNRNNCLVVPRSNPDAQSSEMSIASKP